MTLTDKEKIKQVQNMIDYILKNYPNQPDKTYLVQDLFGDLEVMRNILKED